MSADTIDYAAAWGKLEGAGGVESAGAAPSQRFKHYRPFATAVDGYVAEAREDNRIYVGVDEFDAQMRGIGRKHLLLLNGFTHSGKTLFALHILRHNRMKRVAWFTPDESAEQVLANLASMQTGVAAEELERRIQQDDAEARELLMRVATEEFPNLAVFEQAMTPAYIEEALDEAAEAWGARHDLVVIDFVRLLQAGEDMNAKFEFVKSLAQRRGPVIALNQTSRSAGADGREMTIASGEYGGETYASFVLGVRRKLYEQLAVKRELDARAQRGGRGAADAYDRLPEVQEQIKLHEHTITVNVVKTKRVGGRLVNEVDFELDHVTGRITPLGDHLPKQYVAQQKKRRFGTETPPWQHSWGDDEEAF